MKKTPTQGFSFPEDESFASVVQMKVLAEQFDTDLFAMQTQLNARLRPPTMVRTLPSDVTGVPSSNVFEWSNTLVNTYNNGFSAALALPGPPVTGTYIMGACMQVLCSGTINANSYRRLAISVPIPSGPVYQQVTNNVFQETVNENGNVTLGNQLTVFGMLTFDFVSSNPPQPWNLFFTHANTSSTMTIKAGSFAWATKIADLEN
jgi:hypothetical protein